MDVVHQRLVMVTVLAFHHDGLVTVAKQAAPLVVAHIVSTGQGVLQPGHARDEVGLRRLNEKVIMITHQHPGMDPPARHLTSLAERVKEKAPVIVVMEDGFPAVAPGHHMIIGTGILDAKAARRDR